MPVKSFRAYLALDVVTGDMRLTKTVPGTRQNQVVVILEIKANLPAPVVPTLVVSVDVPQPVVEAVTGDQAKAEVDPSPQPDGSRFSKFSERARRVLSLAQEEAQHLNHNYIGTEHILLGLVRETEGVGAKALTGLNIDLSKVRSATEFMIGRNDLRPSHTIGLTPRAKKVLELASDEARQLNVKYVGTEHLLIGLIREGESIVSAVLESLGATLEKVREQVRAIYEAAKTGKPENGVT